MALGDRQIAVSASIGIAASPPSEGVVEDADAAMYRAKHLGRIRYQFSSGNAKQSRRTRLVS